MTDHRDASLTTMLAAVAGASEPAARADAIVALQRELLAASDSRLVDPDTPGSTGDAALAARAVATGEPVVERRGTAAVVAVALGSVGERSVVAMHSLVDPTPLTLALAGERLALTAAIPGSAWPAAAGLAAALGMSGGLAAAAKLLAARLGQAIVLARLTNGVVTHVADSATSTLSSEHVARLKLAAGEAFDLTTISSATPLPPALTSLAGGRGLAAASGTAGRRGAVIIVVGGTDEALTPIAALVAAVRPAPFELLPAATLARFAARAPLPRMWSPTRREAAVRAGLLALPALLLLLPWPTTVGAPATIAALDQRVVTAPFDGRIDAVAVQPGDTVRGGETVLVRLDARAAENERGEITAELQAALAQAEAAQVDGRSDDERIARLRAAQYTARAAALTLQIAAATIVAPIDGIVSGDDLRRRTGGPVTRGETLLGVAAPGTYRIEARVSDRDIGAVALGQSVTVALKAHPLDRPHGIVSRIYPLAEVEDGDNIFRVVATLDRGTAGLLPGMEGRGAIRTGWAPLGWLLVRAPVRWVRLKLWI